MTTTSKAQRRGLLSRLNLFGGTSAKKWEAENVVPASDITQNLSVMYGSGMTTVASLMSSGKRAARSRDQIYSDWAQMESDPIVSTSIGLLVTSALGGHETSGELVFIEKKRRSRRAANSPSWWMRSPATSLECSTTTPSKCPT